MTAPRTLLDSAQVARRLAMSRDSFCRKWRGLVEAHGFPAPVPGCGVRWDPLAIDRWLDLQLPAHLRADEQVQIQAEPPDYVAELRARIPAALGAAEE